MADKGDKDEVKALEVVGAGDAPCVVNGCYEVSAGPAHITAFGGPATAEEGGQATASDRLMVAGVAGVTNPLARKDALALNDASAFVLDPTVPPDLNLRAA